MSSSPPPPAHRPRAAWRDLPWGKLWLALVLLALALLRGVLVDRSLAESAACVRCLSAPVLGHDAWLLAPAWALLGWAAWSGRRWLRSVLVVPVLLLLVLMTADVAVLTTLGMRLYLFDVFKFGTEGAALGDFIAALLRSSGAGWLVAAVSALLLCLLALRPGRAAPRAGATLLAAAAAALAGGLLVRGSDPAYIMEESILNLFELQQAQTVNRGYSPAFVEGLAQRDAAPVPQCAAGQARRPDVILLAVESLSSYQSALHGGPFDYTPQLDALARRHTWFSRFHANGFTTDHGLIALLAARLPVPAIGRYRSLEAFAGFGDRDTSVTAPLRAAGYETAFFTTGDLGFLDKAPWLRDLGFDHWEGAEHPFYQGWPRGGFGAAVDRALYLRLLDFIRQRDATRPFFAAALTVQSHPPFVDKSSGQLDEAAVFRAVDAEVGRFAELLEQQGFFRNGILLVTGDHRSMTPLHPEERRQFGDRAFARVPMVAIGATGLPAGRIDAPFQQTDLRASLADLVLGESCRVAGEGLFLRADPQPPAWISHVRGDARSRIDFMVGDADGALLLAGDESEWIGAQPTEAQAIADAIHRDRIRRGALDSDVKALVEILAH
jgi:lipoteichoic acid synthase